MPKGLIRIYGQGDWHYITCSCYDRLPMMGSAESRDLFLRLLEETRKKYAFVVAGYVVMPEHFHMLIGEPKVGDPSLVMQVLKQRVSCHRKGVKGDCRGKDQESAHLLATTFL